MSTLNPLDLRGPEFLFFFFVLACVCHGLFRLLIARNETKPLPTALDLTDPYAIAFLRGGAEEAARIAVFSLIDRGLLVANNDKVKSAGLHSADFAKRKIEKAALEFFRTEAHPYDFFKDDKLALACAEYEILMVRNGLTVNDDQRKFRIWALLIALIPLLLLPAAKIYVALQRGRSNVGILIILSAFSLIFLFKTLSSPRTKTGNLFLVRLKQIFSDLMKRAYTFERGGKTNEAALCAAVFGLSALSAGPFSFIPTLFPAASKSRSSTTCSSGCGTSCGSSCGGGCGGGGCGGCGGD